MVCSQWKSIELPIFLFFFGIVLNDSLNSNFIIYRTCYVIMGKDIDECAKLGLNTTGNDTIALEKEVEALANYIAMTLELVSSILPCILCVFIGPFSDKKGRKPILLFSIGGGALTCGVKAIICALPSLSPWYIFAATIPITLTGGIPIVLTIAFCYMVDVSNEKNRGLRIGILECMIAGGICVANLSSSHIFQLIGYTGVSLVSMAALVVGFLIVVLFEDESIIPYPDYSYWNLFSVDLVKQMCVTTWKPRPGCTRMVLFTVITALVIFILAETNIGVETLLLRTKFHWNIEQITTFLSIRLITSITGAMCTIGIAHKLCNIGECTLVVLSTLLCAGNSLVMVIAQQHWQVYAALAFRFCSAVINPMARSFMSKITPHEDIAMVSSFCIPFESLAVIVGRPLYTAIYTSSIHTFPSAFDLIPVAIYITMAISFIFILIMKSRQAFVYVTT